MSKIHRRHFLTGAAALASHSALAQTVTPQIGGGVGLGQGFDGGLGGASGPMGSWNFLTGAYTPWVPSTEFVDTNTSPKYVTDLSGALTLIAPNALPVSNAGLLIEAAATNKCLQSDALTTSPWAVSSLVVAVPTLTANAAVAPDGTTTATRIAYPAVSGAGALSSLTQAIVVTGTQHIWSVYLKGNVGGEVVYISATPNGTTYLRQTCTLTTSWQRFYFTGSPTGTTWYFGIGVDLRDASQSAKGAQTIFATAADVTIPALSGNVFQTVPSSHIKTTTVNVTRAADSVVIQRSGIGQLILTFDDSSTQIVTTTRAAQFTFPISPMTLKRPLITNIVEYATARDVAIPYPTFPYTTIARLQTTSDIQSTSGGGTYVDTAISDSPYSSSAILLTASTSAQSVFSTTILSTGVDVRTGSIRFAFRPHAVFSGVSVFSIKLYSAGSPSSPSSDYHVGFSALGIKQLSTALTGQGRWQSFGVPYSAANFTAVGAGADLSSIKYASISITGSSTSVKCAIGNIDFVPNPRARAALIFRIDDATRTAYDYAFPALAAVGKGAYLTGGAVASQQGFNGSGRLTTAEVTTLLANKWQLASGLYSTEDSTVIDAMTDNARDQEMKNTRDFARAFDRYLDSSDGTGQSNVGISDMTAWPQIRDNFRSFQRGDFFLPIPANPAPAYTGEPFPFGDPYNIQTLQIASAPSAETWAYVEAALDQARANKGVLILVQHNDWATDPNVATACNNAITYCTTTYPEEIGIVDNIQTLLAPYATDPMQAVSMWSPGIRPFASSSPINTLIPVSPTLTTLAWPVPSGGNYWNIAKFNIDRPLTTAPTVAVNMVNPAWQYPSGPFNRQMTAGFNNLATDTDNEVISIINGLDCMSLWLFDRLSDTTATCYARGSANLRTESGFGTLPNIAAGVLATGQACLAGALIKAEFVRGEINHAIALCLEFSLVSAGAPIAPAIGNDGASSTGIAREAQRLAIPRSTSMPAGLSVYGQKLFRALQEYGAFVVDVGGATQFYLGLDYNTPSESWTVADVLGTPNYVGVGLYNDVRGIVPLLQKVN